MEKTHAFYDVGINICSDYKHAENNVLHSIRLTLNDSTGFQLTHGAEGATLGLNATLSLPSSCAIVAAAITNEFLRYFMDNVRSPKPTLQFNENETTLMKM